MVTTPDELDPHVAAVLRDTLAAGGPPMHERPIAEVRADHEREAALLCGPGEPVAEVREVAAPGPAGPIPVRIYVPAERSGGTVAYLHGGGWAIGSLDSFDGICRALANASGATVASVGYRLAPEHPFPAGLEDCLAATRWLLESGDGPLAVAGDSAGGNLAAAVARHERDRLAFQALIYPVCDPGLDTPSYRAFAEGFGLTALGMRRYWALYLDGAAPGPDAAPALADDLAGLPPALVLTASHDVLRDEGEAYAERLRAAGVAVTLRRYEGTIHGFWRWLAATDVAWAAVAEVGAALREALAQAARAGAARRAGGGAGSANAGGAMSR